LTLFKVEAQHSFCIPYYKKSLWGICDTNGKVLLEPKYNSFQSFCIGKKTLISFNKNKKVDVYMDAKLQPNLSK
jgi:hypothetical protein